METSCELGKVLDGKDNGPTMNSTIKMNRTSVSGLVGNSIAY